MTYLLTYLPKFFLVKELRRHLMNECFLHHVDPCDLSK